jgi:hypothetical protein
MSDALHPAVRDIAAAGGLCAAAGAAVVGLGLALHPAGDALSNGVAALAGAALVVPFRAPKDARLIVSELHEAPDAPVDEGFSPAVWSTVGVLAALVVATALLALPIALAGAALLGAGAWELRQAHWLRRWERLNDMRLLYRPDYRWLGTNGRVVGRGWFDPANFVASG